MLNSVDFGLVKAAIEVLKKILSFLSLSSLQVTLLNISIILSCLDHLLLRIILSLYPDRCFDEFDLAAMTKLFAFYPLIL